MAGRRRELGANHQVRIYIRDCRFYCLLRLPRFRFREALMTNSRAALKARAEAAFRKAPKIARNDAQEKDVSASPNDESMSLSRPVKTTEGAMEEYLARREAERANMAKLREQRLAAEAMAATEKAKRKQCGKTK
jgi:hypothetical protein